MNKAKYVPTQTPWGPSQSEREFAPGIVFYSTASHGGYKLSPERWAEFASIPHFAHWSQWLEEDCEACLVYLRWPELATNEQIHDAVIMARTVASWGNGRWVTLVEGWLDKLDQPTQQSILIRAQQHANDVAHLWQRGSMSTNGKGWTVSFRRRDERRDVCMKDYPAKRYYTDDELSRFTPKQVVCRQSHFVDCDDDDTERYANVGDEGKATWDESTEQWSVVWGNGAWGFYTQEELDNDTTPKAPKPAMADQFERNDGYAGAGHYDHHQD